MPTTGLTFYSESNGAAPVLEWLDRVYAKDERVYAKCLAALERLAELGHELRRPTADMLRGGIYELRIRVGNVNYRILYFFHSRNVAVLCHALTKEQSIPKSDLQRALDRKHSFENDPQRHTHQE